MPVRAVSIVISSLLIGALAALYLHATLNERPRVKVTGTALVGGPFELTTAHGKRVTQATYRDRHKLIFFGYTNCPDVCPASLLVVGETLAALGPAAAQVAPLFITVDPERDTPAALKEYMENFDSRITALTGSQEDIARVTKIYRVARRRVASETTGAGSGEDADKNYLMDHTTLLYLMSPAGDYVTHFPFGTKPKTLAETLRRYVTKG